MMRTALNIDERSGKTELRMTVNDALIASQNAEFRRNIGKGFTLNRSMRAVAEIPPDTLKIMALSGDKDALVLFDINSDPMQKKRALRGFLFNHPEYRISDGRL
jgi:rRNA processing protein Krr1/Pno1